jgi:tetratricopeptide (TPR) repeat protein
MQKYPQSEVLSYALAFEANAYQTKGDAAKIVEYAEKSLALKKDNLMSLLLAAYAIPTPQFMSQHGADEPDQLAKADAFCQDALKVVDGLKKQPNETDEAYAKRKALYASSIHADLGMIHLDRAQLGLMGIDKDELAKAEQEYKQAVSLTDNPDASDYFRLGEACRLQGKIDDAIAAFTKASDLGNGPVKQFADQQIAALKQAKAKLAAPAGH